MKKQILFNSLIIGMISATHVNAQVSVANNIAGGTNYVGWNASVTTVPLQIRHNANQPINFFTNNTQRATISSAGNLGIGLTVPQSRLHQYIGSATANYHQFGNSVTGSAAADGLRVGVDASGNGVINQQENLPMIFATNAAERMRVLADGNVGIGTAAPGVRLEVFQATGPQFEIVKSKFLVNLAA